MKQSEFSYLEEVPNATSIACTIPLRNLNGFFLANTKKINGRVMHP